MHVVKIAVILGKKAIAGIETATFHCHTYALLPSIAILL